MKTDAVEIESQIDIEIFCYLLCERTPTDVLLPNLRKQDWFSIL